MMATMIISVMITLRGSLMADFFLLRGDFERLLGIIDLRVGGKGGNYNLNIHPPAREVKTESGENSKPDDIAGFLSVLSSPF